MTRHLHLLRHAKSSWGEPSLSDRDRGLNRRGQRDAPRMGAALSATLEPMTIHCSPARRARDTLAGLIEGWPALGGQPHESEEALYTFSSRELLDFIERCPDSRDTLFLLGHNPGLTDLVNWLCGTQVLLNLPTAGYVYLELACDCWLDVVPGCAELRHRLFPKELDDG